MGVEATLRQQSTASDLSNSQTPVPPAMLVSNTDIQHSVESILKMKVPTPPKLAGKLLEYQNFKAQCNLSFEICPSAENATK